VDETFDESARCTSSVNPKRINDRDNSPGWNRRHVRRRRRKHHRECQDRIVWMIEHALIVTIGWQVTDRVSLRVQVHDGVKLAVDLTLVHVLRRS
jgi:hypothetical protein